jgi:sulfotransferase family protein
VASSQPVILLGRGGSGTRILSQFGVANGVFIGNEVSASGDSLEWVDTIYGLAIECATLGVTAGSPRDALWRDRLRRQAALVLARANRAPDDLWGWKLPETMLALPLVLRAFARARIIHLVRHPLTSALRRTHMTSRLDNPIGRAVLPAAYRASGLDPAQIVRDDEYVHNAVTWNFQLRNVLDAIDEAGAGRRVLQIHYEDCCADPAAAQKRVGRFLGTQALGVSAPVIDRARTHADRFADDRIDRIWSICGATASRIGYRPQMGSQPSHEAGGPPART